MLDFQRKKDTSFLGPSTKRESSFLYFDQSKNLYDFILKHDNQMKQMESEIMNLKSQIMEISTKIPLISAQNNNNYLNFDINSEVILNLKEEIKDDLIKDLNNIIISEKSELKEQINNLKEEIEIMDENKENNNKILEINNSLKNLNQQLVLSNVEKNNSDQIILDKLEKDKKEISNITSDINKRIDNLDLDFDRLIQSLKVQFLNSANTINQLELNKVNCNDYEKQIDIVNQTLEELNNKVGNINQQNRNNIINKGFNGNIITRENEENDIGGGLDKKLNSFKDELYSDLEKINLKILSELKNQADDIKILYQELNTTNMNVGKINKNKAKSQNIPEQIISSIDNTNIMSKIETELSKKANLDQLNFALETQAKLNEAFSSATRISRYCWDSEGTLNENKYIKWSIQSINTALDVFKWENNSDIITILQNGVYRIVIGFIGLEAKSNFGLIFNGEENIIINNNNLITENDNDINNDKENIRYMEKYIALEENTKIKVILLDSNDNSEEAFLEMTKII